MTALAEALLAAQRQAIGALSKAYVAGVLTEEDLHASMLKIGDVEHVEYGRLVNSLDVLREWGVPAPRNGAEPPPPKPMSAAQRARIEKTAKERNYPLPDFDNLTMAQASEVIQTMDSGEYDAARWVVPF